MSNLYRGPSKDGSYQVSIHLAIPFQRRRIFRNQPIRNKNCLWWPCLLTDRDEMSNLYRGPSIYASYQVSLHLAEGFPRRRLKCEKLNGRQTTDAKGWQKLTLPLARWAKNGFNTKEYFSDCDFSYITHSLCESFNTIKDTGTLLWLLICISVTVT